MKLKILLVALAILLIATLAGFAQTQTVYLITFKRVTLIPQPCPENRVGCLVYHCKEDTSCTLTKIFYEEKDADNWIEENENNIMYKAVEIRKEKLTRANSR